MRSEPGGGVSVTRNLHRWTPFHCNALCAAAAAPFSREGEQRGLTGEPLPPLARNVCGNKARFSLKVEADGGGEDRIMIICNEEKTLG